MRLALRAGHGPCTPCAVIIMMSIMTHRMFRITNHVVMCI